MVFSHNSHSMEFCRQNERIEAYENPKISYSDIPDFLKPEKTASTFLFHQSMPFYQETPLVELTALSQYLGVSKIFVKDESKRFSLNAFKGLGGSYAIFRVLCEKFGLEPHVSTFRDLQKDTFKNTLANTVFVTATDGNHGKGIAWAAGLLGCRAKIYMPKGSSPQRVRAIAQTGNTDVLVTDFSYDDTVRYAAADAKANGWTLIQDTSWEGYEKIPAWIVQGYTTLAQETGIQMKEKNIQPTHVFLQAGVGAMAGGLLGYLARLYTQPRPLFSIVEPASVACIHASAKERNGKPVAVQNPGPTIMAGLNCGEPCPLTWPILRACASYFFSCPDYVAAEGMRAYAHPMGNDAPIISGESGAVTLGLLLFLMKMDSLAALRVRMQLNQNAVVLLINTEGNTAPECYKDIIEKGAFPSPFPVFSQ